MSKGFRISARAMRQLGAELITSDEVALNELIKNSIDARSERVVININSPFLLPSDKLLESVKKWPAKKVDSVNYFKKSLAKDIPIELKNRLVDVFLQDKLGTNFQAIEKIIENEVYISVIDSGCGMSEKVLKDAFLVIGTPSKWLLKNNNQEDSLGAILGEKGIGRLSMMRLGQISRVKSTVLGEKFWNYIDFDWKLFDDPEKYIDDIPIDICKGNIKNDANAKGTKIRIGSLYAHWTRSKSEKFVHDFLRRLQNPFSKNRRRYPIDVNFNGERINIDRMYDWFVSSANFSVSFVFNPEDDVFFTRKIKWHGSESYESRRWLKSDFLRELPLYSEDDFNDLGQFCLDALWFNRGNLKIQDLDMNQNTFKEELNLWCGGYAIYRDNFRIGMTGSMEDDWLKMDQTALRSQGFSYNRYQTVGSLSLTSKNNSFLVDSANRESLIECKEYQLLKDILDIANNDLKSHIDTVKQAASKIAISKETTAYAIKKSKENLRKTIESINKLKPHIKESHRSELREIAGYVKTHLEDVQRLEKAVDMAREQRVELLELAGVGLVVDKVIHELARLTARTSEYLDALENAEPSEKFSNVINLLKQQIIATNKRIRTVDNMSPSGRNRKGVFDLVALINTTLAGYDGRFERHAIEATVLIDDELKNKPYKVNMVSGLVAQILENLLDNSLYWLGVGLREGDNKRTITIKVDTTDATLIYFDNGPGVDANYRDEIFRPYHTTKHKGKGLGLFIAKELADYHKANFYLDVEKDFDGRLRFFVLELPKGI